jgi:phosphohistidine swiveling domain-containing protein
MLQEANQEEGKVEDWPVERTARRAAGQTDGVLSDINFGEVFPFVAKPLSRDGLAGYIGPMLGGQVAGLSRCDPLVLDLNPMAFVAGRPYMDLSANINLPSIAYQLYLLEAVDRSKGRAIAKLARAKRLNPVPIPVTARLKLHLASVRMGFRSLRWLLRRRTPVDLRDAYERTTERLRALVRRPLDRDAPSVLLRDLDREFTDESDPTKDGLRHLGLAMLLHTALQLLCDGRIPPDLLDDLAKGVPHNPTTGVSLDLWGLAQAARPLADIFEKTPPENLARALQTTDEGRRWWMRFDEFLARHGHRGEVELDLSTPRWREDPTFLLQTITNYLRHPASAPSPPAVLAEGQRRREAAAAAVRRNLPVPLRGLFTWLYVRYVLWLPFREAMKYTWLLGLEQARRVYRELGRRLVAAGHLKATDDVFWLRQHEVRAWAETGSVTWTQATLESREREWREWTTRRPPPLIVGTRGAPDVASPVGRQPHATVLRGTPVSTGHAEGVARVITDPHHAELRAGEVLVTRYTDPAWTPLFFTAGALITEIGGVLSHGAVIAREIGLPAVVGVEGATSWIATGRRVKVNAYDGTVELL